MPYIEYIKIPFSDHEKLMEGHEKEWYDNIAVIGDSVLVPKEWRADAAYNALNRLSPGNLPKSKLVQQRN